MNRLAMCVLAAAVAGGAVNQFACGQTPGAGAAAAPSAGQPAAARTLRVGDAAPGLEGVTWLKGEAVGKFEPGRVYIVEVWATWCGPCRKSIPHLTKIQEQHQDRLTVVGVSCWERKEDAAARVAAARTFVEGQGEAMAYTVAADGDGVVVRDWMQPAGRRSIPSAFIVDGAGNIAWMGNPLDGMDAVLEKVLAGGFDARAEAEKAAVAAAAKKIRDELFARANLAAQKGNHEEAIGLVDQVLAMETDAAARVPMLRQKLRMLLGFDEAPAHAFARSLLEGELKDNDFGLYTIADSLIRSREARSPDHALEVELMVRAAALADPKNATVHEGLSMAKGRAGDRAGAIAAAERALEILREQGGGTGEAIRRVEARLAELKRG